MNTSNRKEFLRLVTAWLKGKATQQQQATVEKYFDLFSGEQDFFIDQSREEINKVRNRLKMNIDARIQAQERPLIKLYAKYLSAAAAILIISGLYFYNSRPQSQHHFTKQSIKMTADISPGSNKAILTLSNGAKIFLNDIKNGKIASQHDTGINKEKDGKLVYSNSGLESVKLAYNTIETPKGGQYQLVLSDGTKVWLNAASSLHYPLLFKGKERKVELIGEAYFEVAKNKKSPFMVFTKGQVVEVLGTHFNINAYSDEPLTKTTLLEGKISINNLTTNINKIVNPGEQALMNVNSDYPVINIRNVDVDEAIAWKNGYFMFDAEPLESVLKKISRWYDVDIQYKNGNSNQDLTFSGTLSRYSNVSKVLKKLELTGSVDFKIEGRRILVTLL